MTEQRKTVSQHLTETAGPGTGRRTVAHRRTGRASPPRSSTPRAGLWAEHDPVPPERLSSHRCVAALALGMAEARLDPRQCATELAEASDRPLLQAAADHLDRVDHGEPEVIGRARNLVCAALALVGE